MRINGIVFDLDGVICSTDKYHFQAWIDEMKEVGVEISDETLQSLRGVSRKTGLENILNAANYKASEQEKDDFCNSKNQRYIKLLENVSPSDLDPRVKEALLKLKEMGIKIGIGSGSRNAPLVLKKLGIYDMFDGVADGSMIKNSKPDPEIFLLGAKLIGLTSKECLVVEDAYSGIDAANAGGFRSVGISLAANYDKALYKINELYDLIDLVNKINRG